MNTITDKEIRSYMGHRDNETYLVRVTRDGSILIWGSPDPANRSQDFWWLWGTREAAVREIRSVRMQTLSGTELANEHEAAGRIARHRAAAGDASA